MTNLPEVELNAESIEAGKLYIWKLPYGGKKVVWKNKEGDGIAEYDDFTGEDHWYFKDSLVGNIYGPFGLNE